MYMQNIVLKEYEIAGYMADRDEGIKKAIEQRRLPKLENMHLVVVSEETNPKLYHKHFIDLWTIRRNKAHRVFPFKYKGIETKQNAGQSFLVDDILNPMSQVKVLAVTGNAGTGKTFATLAASVRRELTSQIIYTREVVEVGEELGFLPGEIGDKFRPYLAGFWDNVEEIENLTGQTSFGRRFVAQPLQFMRGRSLKETVLIVDEAQNCIKNVVKMAGSRLGENSMGVFMGSFNQIDNVKVNRENNGLAELIKAFNGQRVFSHVHLEIGERSEVAMLFDELL